MDSSSMVTNKMGRASSWALGIVILTVAVTFYWSFARGKSRHPEAMRRDFFDADQSSAVFNSVKERSRWQARIKETGAPYAYGEFKEVYLSTLPFEKQHLALHVFGETLYEVEGDRGLAVCDSAFLFGCYHGFFTRAISERTLEAVGALDRVCKDLGSPADATACEHGIGHGILEYLGHERFEEALLACARAPQRDTLYGCTAGVFMEYNMPVVVTPASVALRFRELDPSRPYDPCPSLPERFRESCYHELVQWWDEVFKRDYRKIGLLCDGLMAVKEREACLRGIGNVVAPSSGYDAEETVRRCRFLPRVQATSFCLAGASRSFSAFAPKRILAPRLCEELEVREATRCLRDLKGL